MTQRKSTRYIVIHCSASQPKSDIGVKEITAMHKARGFRTIGYHYVIRRDGTREVGRPINQIGAHVSGHNFESVGVCMIGGINAKGKAENNYTKEQFDDLADLLRELKPKFPIAEIVGHRDLSPDTNGDGKVSKYEWVKDCPCFDVADFVKENKL
jgi:N-acetyl-anhydromuramyl-L-alanine amidase AmpD